MLKNSLSNKLVSYILSIGLAVGNASFALPAYAMPVGGHITSGKGSISSSSHGVTIKQLSPNISINWNSFNISKGQYVKYLQPNSSYIAFNEINSILPSYINGSIIANGRVFLLNPYGILFGPSSEVAVAGLVASGLKLSAYNPLTGSFNFTGTGNVENYGHISVMPGGNIALIGNKVSNNSSISAPQGSITFGAGNNVSLLFNDNNAVKLNVNSNTAEATINNSGVLSANGGTIQLKAGASDSLVASLVENTGNITAENGNITLLSGKKAGTTIVGGILNASAPISGNGGFIETSGERVNILPNAFITTAALNGKVGTWLMDPVSFYIGENTTGTANNTYGNVLNYEDISGTSLGTALNYNNVVIQSTQGTKGTQGNIYINNAITWNTGNNLTLEAANNIEINNAITNTAISNGSYAGSTYGNIILKADDMAIGGVATNTTGGGVPSGVGVVAVNNGGSLSTLGNVNIYTNISNYGTSGALTANSGTLGGSFTNSNSSGYINTYALISSNADLYYIDNNQTSTVLGNNYALNTNITLPSVTSSTSTIDITQIQNATTANTGSYSGLGSGDSNWIRFGGTSTPFTGNFNGQGYTISNLTITNDTKHTSDGFIGYDTGSFINNIGLINPSITGGSSALYLGSLVGYFNNGSINNSYVSSGTISENISTTSNIDIGGLVGDSYEIYNSYVKNTTVDPTITIQSSSNEPEYVIGGVSGQNGTLFNVNGFNNTVSITDNSSIYDSYKVGGVVGWNNSNIYNSSNSGGSVSITQSTACDAVIREVGGFAGESGSVWNSFSSASVSANDVANIGGLVGDAVYIHRSYATGNVTTDQEDTSADVTTSEGGLVGIATSGISNSYSTGSVTGSSNSSSVNFYEGGLSGNTSSVIKNSYSLGTVTASGTSTTEEVGGFLGTTTTFCTSCTFTNNYFNTTPGGANSTAFSNGNVTGITGQSLSSFASMPSGFSTNTWTSTGFSKTASVAPWYMGNVSYNGSTTAAPMLIGTMPSEIFTATNVLQQYSNSSFNPNAGVVTSTGGTSYGGVGLLTTMSAGYTDTLSTTGVTYTVNNSSGQVTSSLSTSGSYTIVPSGISAGTAPTSETSQIVPVYNGLTTVDSNPYTPTSNQGTANTSSASTGMSNYNGSINTQYFTALPPVGVVVAAPIQLTLDTTASSVYSGSSPSVTIGGTNYTFGNVLSGQSAVLNTNISGTLSSSNVGSNLSGTLNSSLSDSNFTDTTSAEQAFYNALSSGNYILPSTFSGASITPKALSCSSCTGGTIFTTYNGSTSVTIPSTSISAYLTGFVGGQGATFNNSQVLTGTLNSANAGNETYSVNINLSNFTANSGTTLSNYSFSSSSLIGNAYVSQKELTFNGGSIFNNPTKTYNGTTTATLTPQNSTATLSGFVNGQGATYIGGTGNYASPNVGSGISISAILGSGNFSSFGSGFLWNNYMLPYMHISGIGTILAAAVKPAHKVNTVDVVTVTPAFPGFYDTFIQPENDMVSPVTADNEGMSMGTVLQNSNLQILKKKSDNSKKK